jgi:hypothetical protein
MAQNSQLHKMKKKLLARIKAAEAEIEKDQEKLDAVEFLLQAEEGETKPQKDLFKASEPTKLYGKDAQPKRQKGASKNIKAAILGMSSNSFMFKEIQKALQNTGFSYGTSTISSTVRKMIKQGELIEGAKIGKERTYSKKK